MKKTTLFLIILSIAMLTIAGCQQEPEFPSPPSPPSDSSGIVGQAFQAYDQGFEVPAGFASPEDRISVDSHESTIDVEPIEVTIRYDDIALGYRFGFLCRRTAYDREAERYVCEEWEQIETKQPKLYDYGGSPTNWFAQSEDDVFATIEFSRDDTLAGTSYFIAYGCPKSGDWDYKTKVVDNPSDPSTSELNNLLRNLDCPATWYIHPIIFENNAELSVQHCRIVTPDLIAGFDPPGLDDESPRHFNLGANRVRDPGFEGDLLHENWEKIEDIEDIPQDRFIERRETFVLGSGDCRHVLTFERADEPNNEISFDRENGPDLEVSYNIFDENEFGFLLQVVLGGQIYNMRYSEETNILYLEDLDLGCMQDIFVSRNDEFTLGSGSCERNFKFKRADETNDEVEIEDQSPGGLEYEILYDPNDENEFGALGALVIDEATYYFRYNEETNLLYFGTADMGCPADGTYRIFQKDDEFTLGNGACEHVFRLGSVDEPNNEVEFEEQSPGNTNYDITYAENDENEFGFLGQWALGEEIYTFRYNERLDWLYIEDLDVGCSLEEDAESRFTFDNVIDGEANVLLMEIEADLNARVNVGGMYHFEESRELDEGSYMLEFDVKGEVDLGHYISLLNGDINEAEVEVGVAELTEFGLDSESYTHYTAYFTVPSLEENIDRILFAFESLEDNQDDQFASVMIDNLKVRKVIIEGAPFCYSYGGDDISNVLVDATPHEIVSSDCSTITYGDPATFATVQLGSSPNNECELTVEYPVGNEIRQSEVYVEQAPCEDILAEACKTVDDPYYADCPGEPLYPPRGLDACRVFDTGELPEPEVCTDTDGDNIHTQGTVEGVEGVETDHCAAPDVVVEYTCKDSEVVSADHVCEFGCENGACLAFNILDCEVGDTICEFDEQAEVESIMECFIDDEEEEVEAFFAWAGDCPAGCQVNEQGDAYCACKSDEHCAGDQVCDSGVCVGDPASVCEFQNVELGAICGDVAKSGCYEEAETGLHYRADCPGRILVDLGGGVQQYTSGEWETVELCHYGCDKGACLEEEAYCAIKLDTCFYENIVGEECFLEGAMTCTSSPGGTHRTAACENGEWERKENCEHGCLEGECRTAQNAC